MKIKSVLLAGLISAAGALSVSAVDEVFSVNVVGFANITVPAGAFKIVSNPLNQADNTLPTILPTAPVGTRIFKFNAGNQTFTTFTKLAGGWSPASSATTAFNPGEAFFVKAPAAADLTLTFVGEVAQGATLTITVPTGFSLIAPHVPQSASLETELGLAARQGDRVYFFRNGNYQIATRLSSTWTAAAGVLDVNGQPRPEVGEGFFFQNKQASSITWVREFNANTPTP